jgi:hypothetical protein
MSVVIINLTQHEATEDQKNAGVVNIDEKYKSVLIEALNFRAVPDMAAVMFATDQLALIMQWYDPHLSGDVQFMVGGAPYLMACLTRYAPIYSMLFACSDRVSEEQHMPDGSVRKVNVFKHIGFTPMYCPDM